MCIYRLSLSLSFVMFLIKLCISCLFHGLLLEPRKFLVSAWPELFCIMYFLWLSSATKPLLSFIVWVWVLYLGPIFLPQSAHRFRSKSGQHVLIFFWHKKHYFKLILFIKINNILNRVLYNIAQTYNIIDDRWAWPATAPQKLPSLLKTPLISAALCLQDSNQIYDNLMK